MLLHGRRTVGLELGEFGNDLFGLQVGGYVSESRNLFARDTRVSIRGGFEKTLAYWDDAQHRRLTHVCHDERCTDQSNCTISDIHVYPLLLLFRVSPSQDVRHIHRGRVWAILSKVPFPYTPFPTETAKHEGIL